MKGKIRFECSDNQLEQGFEWARHQALAYTRENDPVGLWYEAALPTREAFCMRDLSHQARGAHALGLEKYTKNMLLRFAQSIAESRDFCCFWEINRYYAPAPVDYVSDDDFWYNLPGSFDILDACYRMYLLTGDEDYIKSQDFMNFYDLTMHEFIQLWDTNGDGIPDARPNAGHRGIASYNESKEAKTIAMQMLDMVAAEQRACRSYAEIKKLTGDLKTAEEYLAMADKFCQEINDTWWDPEKKEFFFIKCFDGSYMHPAAASYRMPLFFGAVTDPEKISRTLDISEKQAIDLDLVEASSYLPELFYRYGEPKRGAFWLRKLISPSVFRREYPEVSYSVIANYVFDLMGIRYDLASRSIHADPHLPEEIHYAAVRNLPVYGREADVEIKDGISKIIMH